MSTAPKPTRRILLEANTARDGIDDAVSHVAAAFRDRGVDVRMPASTIGAVGAAGIEPVEAAADAARDCDLVLVLGGDGTFLRASEFARGADVPVLGVNLGRIGFLAESEASTLDGVVEHVVAGDFTIVDRMTVDVVVRLGDHEVGRGWALNEASVERTSTLGVLEASIEVDGRPVSDYGCDGVLVSTPTGSTAYAFSAGGPIVWPELDAILVVPNNAHALFARPLVVAPSSRVAVETGAGSHEAVVVLDGRRTVPAPPGSRIEVVRGERDVRWVRLDDAPFTDRLVRKFHLPVTGWRGRSDDRA